MEKVKYPKWLKTAQLEVETADLNRTYSQQNAEQDKLTQQISTIMHELMKPLIEQLQQVAEELEKVKSLMSWTVL